MRGRVALTALLLACGGAEYDSAVVLETPQATLSLVETAGDIELHHETVASAQRLDRLFGDLPSARARVGFAGRRLSGATGASGRFTGRTGASSRFQGESGALTRFSGAAPSSGILAPCDLSPACSWLCLASRDCGREYRSCSESIRDVRIPAEYGELVCAAMDFYACLASAQVRASDGRAFERACPAEIARYLALARAFGED